MPEPDAFRFELDRLVSYDDADVIAEMHRVAGLLPPGRITRTAFDSKASITSGTLGRRFGGWKAALEAAGLGDRYGGPRRTTKMIEQHSRRLTDEEILAELRSVAALLGRDTLTVAELRTHSAILSDPAVRRRFGSWKNGLAAAGLRPTPLGRRWTDDDYFENLLEVWTFRRRAPYSSEMNEPPSRISSGAYEHKWGTWNKARIAFLDRVNDVPDDAPPIPPRHTPSVDRRPKPASVRGVPIGLRYQILRRDRFRCVLCGASPATDLGCTLHVDHIEPVARGGATVDENLRSLCQKCNLGKGSRPE